MQHPNIASERLKYTFCNVCPLRGQRVVGSDGPLSASHLCIADAPDTAAEEWGLRYGDPYGRPLVGASGGVWKLEELAGAGLCTVTPRPPKPSLDPETGEQIMVEQFPHVELTDVWATNVIMCKVPNDKVDSPIGRKAAMCCAPSLRIVVRRLLSENPDRTIEWMGATALTFGQGRMLPKKGEKRKKVAISAWRGRPTEPTPAAIARLNAALEDVPADTVIRFALRGVKVDRTKFPAEVEKYIKKFCATVRRNQKKRARAELVLAFVPHNLVLKTHISSIVKKTKQGKKEKDHGKP